jgi:phage terminase large subunit
MPAPRQSVTIPYQPRPLQKSVHSAMRSHRFGVLVCHRRFGKTVLSVNELIRSALTSKKARPRYGYIAPTYRQGKAVAWDYLRHFSAPVPGVGVNVSELRIDYPNGGQVRIYGGDNPDSLRGLYFDGVVLDEYGLHPANVFSEVIAPALSDRAGWALFIGTPNGRNQFYEMATKARLLQSENHPDWHFAEHKASDTGYVAPEELRAAKAVMTDDEYAQEYECSFEAAVKGAIYTKELEAARTSGRITNVPVDPILPVDTDWDLGVGDHTGIWFTQSTRSGEIRVVDYYEASGEGLPFYATMLKEKGYTYGAHWAPHDINVREFASGRSRLETAASLGIRFQIAPRVPIEDGIHAGRMLFPRCWFDAVKTQPGIEALMHYRRDYNQRLNEFKATPVHDWASHAADAWRGLATRQKVAVEIAEPEVYRRRSAWG